MRYLILLILFLSLITGCTQETPPESSNKSNEKLSTENESESEQTSDKGNADLYVPNPQVTDDRNLVAIGESVSDEKGELQLKAYKQMDQKVQIGPVMVTFREAKKLHYQPDYSLIDFFHSYTHEESFEFIKVWVEIENTSDEALHFAPVATLKTDTGELKTWEDDIYLEELNGMLKPGAKKAGNLGFIIEKSSPNSISITTSKVLKNKEEISSEQNIEIAF